MGIAISVRQSLLIGLAAINWFSAAAVADGDRPVIETRKLAVLPQAVTNNAVAVLETESGSHIFSFLGLGPARSWNDTLNLAFALSPGNSKWVQLESVPGSSGRLASTAVAVNSNILIFGGYTVAEDGTEVSVPDVHRYDPVSGTYQVLPAMPVPVDDAVALTYLDRYIYLVSGWHDDDNVNLVQVFDAREYRWFQATPYPGSPVFGHSGAIVGRQLIICDGVRILVATADRREFATTDECYTGVIDPIDPQQIGWQQIPPHPGKPRYRMGATGIAAPVPASIFVGGSTTPYNYDGIGYDGQAAEPESLVLRYLFATETWESAGILATATMDHRGLLRVGSGFVIVGGMGSGQTVSNDVLYFELP